ncbi:hypothetical protein B0H11DRAFT_1943746 [Mycena galericulata]|nr:hypothetical protein B0H11DRAFT_1943746 [Mycena galericulata]
MPAAQQDSNPSGYACRMLVGVMVMRTRLRAIPSRASPRPVQGIVPRWGAEDEDVKALFSYNYLLSTIRGEPVIGWNGILGPGSAVDLETGKDDLLMITRALDSYHDNPFHNVTLSVSDAVASVTMLPGQHTFLMLHWTKQYSLILTCNSDPSSAASVVFLVPRHIVLKTESREGGAQIHIISSEVFDTYFAPAIGVDGVGEHAKVSANNLPKLGTMSGPHIWECVHKISLHACALHHDTYRLWVHGSTYDVAGGSSSENVVSRYDLLLHPGRLPQWHHRASHSVPETLYHGFTYTGHSLYREWSGMHQTHQIIAPTSTSTSFLDGGQLDLSVYIDVSPYSGAITFSTSTSIFIRYFK